MQRSKVYIGTVYEFDMWQNVVTGLWERAAPRALDGQLEKCPKTGKQHVQLKIWLNDLHSIKQMQKYLQCSWTPVGRDNCPDYAIKEETRLEGPL